MGGGGKLFVLAAGEDLIRVRGELMPILLKSHDESKRTNIGGNQMNFSVSVLSGLRGGHIDDLERTKEY